MNIDLRFLNDIELDQVHTALLKAEDFPNLLKLATFMSQREKLKFIKKCLDLDAVQQVESPVEYSEGVITECSISHELINGSFSFFSCCWPWTIKPVVMNISPSGTTSYEDLKLFANRYVDYL